MLHWTQAPWTLRAYVVIALAGTVVVAIVVSSTPVAPRLFRDIVALVRLLHPATRRYFAKPDGEVSH